MEVQVKNGKVSEMLVPSAALAVPFAVMDRRRPGAVGAMHGSMGVPRPSSAPRRRHVAEPRKELLKQSSVPNLAQVPDRLGDGNARARRSAQVQAAYDPRAMRRAASATTLGARPDRREDYASRMAAGRPLGGRYDSSMFHPSEPLGRQSMGGFPKADALQLESRLTQRLREHSFNSMEPTRRPSRRKGQVLLGAAPEYRERDRLSQSLQGRSPMYRTAASTAWPEGVPLSGSFSNFGTPNRRPLHSTTSSPYQPSTYSQFGGAPTESGESSLKIYSDLFEEVIERDRVFGPLLRKVKSAYDSMLHSQDASTFAPLDGTAGSLRASHEPRGRSSEPTIRAEVTTSEPWELHRENQALKDLIERLHMELEEAVKREQRWKTKAAKLKARFSSPMTQAVHQHQGLQGWMPGDQGYPDWACHEGDLMNLQPGAMSSHGVTLLALLALLAFCRTCFVGLPLSPRRGQTALPRAAAPGPPLTLTEENVEVVLQEARYHHLQNCFGYVEESSKHGARDVLRRVKKYLMQRIPEIAEVDVSDPDDLIDEGRDRSGKFYHYRD
eukprot:s410_g9.t4